MKGRKKKKFKKNRNSPTGAGVNPRSPDRRRCQPVVARQPRVNTCACQVVPNFFNFFKFKKNFFLEVWEMGQGF
jgi:hypothetical protein